MKTVFFNNLPIYLVTDLKHESEPNFYAITEIDVLSTIVNHERELAGDIYLYNEDSHRLWIHFASQFKVIEAAGGKVFNKSNEVLFIYRNDKWDLPKGKIEKGESIEEAGIREVEEETGIENLIISEQTETTYHIYEYKKKYVLKVSYWFKMSSNFKGELAPQLEEGITKVKWLSSAEIEIALKDTYENIKLLF